MNKNPKAVARYLDANGNQRTIHRHRGKRLAVARLRTTVVIQLNHTVGAMLGERVRAARKRAGFSLSELCERAGLVSVHPKSRMYEIEKGARKEGVRLGTLYALALALGCPVADLLPTTEEVLAAGEVRLKQAPTLVVTEPDPNDVEIEELQA